MNKEKLKPCPICKGDANIDSDEIINEQYDPDTLVVLDYEHNSNPLYSVCCENLCIMTVPCESEEEAIAKWNKRTPEIVYCRECVHNRAIAVTEPKSDRLVGCDICMHNMPLDGYCSNGRRKQEDE